jgi:hypothetical protein
MAAEFIINTNISGKNVVYKELKIKHLKSILKCLAGESPDSVLLFENLNNILVSITNKNVSEIEKLNIIEYFILLFEIRSISMGSSIFAETNTTPSMKLEVSVQKLIDKLKEVDNEISKVQIVQDFVIQYKLPTIKDIIEVNNNNIENYYSLFVRGFYYKTKNINFENLSPETCKTVLDNLPIKISQNIFKKIEDIIKAFNNINLLSYLSGIENTTLYFNFNIQNLILLIELLFGMSLLSLYENSIMLCKVGNLTPEFIENSTPGEYILYIKKLQEIVSVNKNSNQISNSYSSTPFDNIGARSSSEFTP